MTTPPTRSPPAPIFNGYDGPFLPIFVDTPPPSYKSPPVMSLPISEAVSSVERDKIIKQQAETIKKLLGQKRKLEDLEMKKRHAQKQLDFVQRERSKHIKAAVQEVENKFKEIIAYKKRKLKDAWKNIEIEKKIIAMQKSLMK